jgi:hypothetical protein
MLILAPISETGQVLEYLTAVRMKNMGAVLMNKDTRIIVVIVGVASDMHAFIDDQDFLARIGCETFSHDAACEAGSNDEIVKHPFHSWDPKVP